MLLESSNCAKIRADNTHFVRGCKGCKGGYRSMADLLFDWFGFGQTNKSVVY